jgi:hypothetical protein
MNGINNEVKKFQINISQVIFEQALEYLLWKTEHYENLEELRKAIKNDIKKVHNRNMKNFEDVIKD